MDSLESDIAALRRLIDSLRHSHTIRVDGSGWVDDIEDHVVGQGLALDEISFSDIEAAARTLNVI